MRIGIVVAVAENGGIGYKGRLPWRLKGDMAFFKTITSTTEDPDRQNAVVMGRNTWLSIPEKFRPLPSRLNVVISTTMPKGANIATPSGKLFYVTTSLDEALHLVKVALPPHEKEVETAFVIGGHQLFQSVLASELPLRMFYTRVKAEMECDTFFPTVDWSAFHRIQWGHLLPHVDESDQEEDGIKYNFEVYERR